MNAIYAIPVLMRYIQAWKTKQINISLLDTVFIHLKERFLCKFEPYGVAVRFGWVTDG